MEKSYSDVNYAIVPLLVKLLKLTLAKKSCRFPSVVLCRTDKHQESASHFPHAGEKQFSDDQSFAGPYINHFFLRPETCEMETEFMAHC